MAIPLNKELKSFEFGQVPFGGKDLTTGTYEYGGGIYNVQDTGKGTRIVTYVGSVADEKAKKAADKKAKEAKDKAAAQLKEQQAKVDAFTGKLDTIPTQLEDIRNEMGIPQAFATYGAAGKQVQDIAGTVSALPEAVEQALAGQGVSAGQITGRQAFELKELQPTISSATQGLQASGLALETILGDYSSRIQGIFTPLEIEAGLLGQGLAGAFDVYKTSVQGELDMELQKLQNQGAFDLKSLENAMKLAEIEASTQQGSFVDLGNQIALISPFSGQILSSFNKGLTPVRGSSGGGGGDPLGLF